LKILFLSQRVPYPPNRGDKITTWRLIERMRRDHKVEIVAFAHDEADVKAAKQLEDMGYPCSVFKPKPRWRALPLLATKKPLTLGVFGSKAMQREVDRRVPGADLVYAYSSSMGAYYLDHDIPRVMHFAELDSDKWHQYHKRMMPPVSWIYWREWHTLFAFEKRLANTVDENVFCTHLEQEIFKDRIPGVPSLVIRNGVDLEHHVPTPEKSEQGHLVFCGVMNYYPNVEGCVWFCNEILPKVRERHPKVRFSIVGAHPTEEVQRLGVLEGVEVTGFVDDPREWLLRGAISVAPLRIARGIQNKVLEALALGLPVVGTDSATQGLGGQNGRDYLVADDVDGQVEAVCGLLRDRDRARDLGLAGRRFVEENYDWEACLQPLDEVLERITKS
jgi:sugar transferase (PEP-CTERM/EpsH1 system associated)